MIISLVLGLLMQVLGISPIKSLLYIVVLYGITVPVLIALILHICNNRKIMGEYINNKRTNVFRAIALVLMTLTAGALIYLQIRD